MTTYRLPLITAVALVGLLLAQFIVETFISVLFYLSTPGLGDAGQLIPTLFSAQAIAPIVLRVVAFGIGVFVSLNWIARVRESDGWRATIVRGVIATLIGVAAVIVVAIIGAVITASSPGSFPFGYSFSPSINGGQVASSIPAAFESGLTPLVNWVVAVVLAVVLQKVWVARHANAAEAVAGTSATDRASVSA